MAFRKTGLSQLPDSTPGWVFLVTGKFLINFSRFEPILRRTQADF